MEVATLRRVRRFLSAIVSLSAIALVSAGLQGRTQSAPLVGSVAAVACIASTILLVAVWRKEHAANEAAFVAREQAQLAMMKLQIELARRKAAPPEEP